MCVLCSFDKTLYRLLELFEGVSKARDLAVDRAEVRDRLHWPPQVDAQFGEPGLVLAEQHLLQNHALLHVQCVVLRHVLEQQLARLGET